MRRLLPLLLPLVLLAACATEARTRIPIAKPAEGYRALRLTVTQQLPWRGSNVTFQVGTVLVADQMSQHGELLWCGDGGRGCALWDGERITLWVETYDAGGPFVLPPGTFEEIRVR